MEKKTSRERERKNENVQIIFLECDVVRIQEYEGESIWRISINDLTDTRSRMEQNETENAQGMPIF